MSFALWAGFSTVLGVGIQLHHDAVVVNGCRAQHDFVYPLL